jgi:Predicted hydrolases or acyltransferases (alpha/beta hydrolase superfamily)
MRTGLKYVVTDLFLLIVLSINIYSQSNVNTITSRGVNIAYTEAGKGDTTLLFVHGAYINKEYWSAQVEYFSPEYRVVTIDMAGHGESGKNRTDWTMESFGEDIANVIKQLNLKNVFLIGHSMGGDVILEAAMKAKDNVIGLIGVDNFKNAGTEFPPEIQKEAGQILMKLKTDFVKTSENFAKNMLVTSATDSAISSRVINDFKNFDPLIGHDILSTAFSYSKRERELLQQLTLKLNLISVNYIPLNEEPLKKYAAAGYAVFPFNGTCHYPMIEDAQKFNKILENIIANNAK